MPEQVILAWTRGATGVLTRRQSLPTVGSAMLALGLASPIGAAKGNKKDKQQARKAKKKFRKRCNQNKAQCRAEFSEAGGLFLSCCESCFTDDFVACILSFLGETQ